MAVAQKNVQKMYPKWPLDKWKQRLKPAQPKLFNFEPHPYIDEYFEGTLFAIVKGSHAEAHLFE